LLLLLTIVFATVLMAAWSPLLRGTLPQMQNRQCHRNDGLVAVVLPGTTPGSTPTNKRLCREVNRRDMAYFLAIVPAAYWPLGASAEEPAAQPNAMDRIILESRRKAKEDSKKIVAWNPRAYKIPTQSYNSSDLQSFLPTLFQVRTQFERIEKQMENPKTNLTNPEFYDLLRGLNRKEPIKLLRKEAFRTRMWLRTQKRDIDYASNEYERIKRALDEEDTSCLLLSRSDSDVDAAQIRTAKKNVRAVVDAIDLLIELSPEDDQDTAKIVSDTKPIPPIDWTIKLFSRRDREAAEAAANSSAKEAAKNDMSSEE